MKSLLLILSFLIFSSALPAADVGPQRFVSGSLAKILESRKSKPFVLLLWQLDCTPCLKEFRSLSGTVSQHPEFDLVLIATDDLSNKDSVKQVLAQNHLGMVESWIFADSNAQRLRYEIDPSWYGEVPRVYFFDAAHQRTAFSGALTENQIMAWLEAIKR